MTAKLAGNRGLPTAPVNRKLALSRRVPPAIIRPLAATDPRSPDHPSQRAGWQALAEALGRCAARRAKARMDRAYYGDKKDDDQRKL